MKVKLKYPNQKFKDGATGFRIRGDQIEELDLVTAGNETRQALASGRIIEVRDEETTVTGSLAAPSPQEDAVSVFDPFSEIAPPTGTEEKVKSTTVNKKKKAVPGRKTK